ncbi:MAG: AtpZ/AtpI family protein [Puia sp.]|nr:AtpZ/AtpI family protein [Puia sp.]
MVKKIPVQDNRAILLKYAGLGGQLCVAVGLSVFAGLKADKWVKTSFPLFAWVLPLLVIVALIVKLIKDTSGNGGQH